MAVRPALWLVDKPAGPTSHDVVAGIRRRLGRAPRWATPARSTRSRPACWWCSSGVRPASCPGSCAHDKTYLATLRTGFTSATGDPEGPVEAAGRPSSAAALAGVLPSFMGRQVQRVPALAAVRVDGERLYRRARRGEPVEGPEREIVVHELELAEDHGDGVVTLAVRCSAGTYVRRLASDIGERLGCGAYLVALRRTAVGSLSVDDALPPDAVGPGGGLDPGRALSLPARVLTEDEIADVRHGRPVPPGTAGAGEEAVALLAPDGRLVAVARPGSAGLRPAVVLEDPA